MAASGIKLRDSCESCAGSKVRCSKDKPTCHRCAERKSKCVYLIQQRTGRKFRRQESMSSTTSFFPDLDTTAGLSLFDSSFNPIEESTSASTASDGFLPSYTSTDSLSLPVTPSHHLLGQPITCPEHLRNYAAGDYTLNDTNACFQSYEDLLSVSGEMNLDGEEFGLASGLASLTSAFPAVNQSTSLSMAGSQKQPDSLETALRLMQQLSHGGDHLSLTCLTITGHEHQTTEAPQLQIVLDRNKKAIEVVRSTLQSTCSQDGYFLVVVCLVVSKVLTMYACAVRASGACENDKRRSSASASSTPGKSKDPLAAQRVLDALYQVQAGMDELGAKMQLWAKQNCSSGNEAFPIGNETSQTALVGFPFSATVLNQLYTEVRKRLSALSLGLIDELKRYWA